MARPGLSLALAVARALPAPIRTSVARSAFLSRALTRVVGGPGAAGVITIPAGPLRGAQMELNVGEEKAYWTGVYEPESQRLLESLPLDGRLAWDVGAHIGFFTLLLARRCRRVVAVEPNPDAARRLQRNVALNDAAVDVVEAAVGARSGAAQLVGSGRESRVASAGGDGGPVTVTTLDELAARFGVPDFVKLDVEGAEAEALAGAAHVLAAHPTWFIEVHSAELRGELETVLECAAYDVRETSPWRLLATPR